MAKVKPTPESYMHFTMVDKWGRLVGVPGDRMEAFLRQQETQTERPQGLELTAEQMDRIREAAAASGLEMTPRQQEPESETMPEDQFPDDHAGLRRDVGKTRSDRSKNPDSKERIQMSSDSITITVISGLLKEKYQLHVSSIELNLMLIATGDLVDTALGKVETKQGRTHGILGEYRMPPDKAPYWIPLYDQAGVQYVEQLAISVFCDRIPSKQQSEPHISEPHTEIGVKHDIKCFSVEKTCYTCKLLKNGGCGMPQNSICAWYEPCYIPTANDIENWENAKEGFGVAGYMTQTALGDIDSTH